MLGVAWVGVGSGVSWKGHWGNILEMMEVLCFLIVAVVKQVYLCQNSLNYANMDVF